MKKFFQNNKPLVSSIFLSCLLWFFVWATYNTDMSRIFYAGFPHNIFDLLHGIRSFFPFLALIVSMVILFRKNTIGFSMLKGPLGLLGIYAVIGMLAAVFSTHVFNALYWGSLYFSAIIILMAIITKPYSSEKISAIFWMNIIIASIITLGLMAVFFLEGGISISFLKQFLSGGRPFESLGNLYAQMNIFGMAGTRPTGLGRYAGLVALVALAGFWHPNRKVRIFFYSLCILMLLILIFSRARTSIVAFIIVACCIFFYKASSKINFIFVVGAIALLLAAINFYPVSWTYLKGETLLQPEHLYAVAEPEKPAINSTAPVISSPAPVVVVNNPPIKEIVIPNTKEQERIHQENLETQNNIIATKNKATFTLSGRTTGIWPESLELFSKSPVLGFGFNADRLFLEGQHAHNSVLQALVQSGVVGTMFFILAFGLAWFWLLLLFRRHGSRVDLLMIFGVLAYFTLRGITESTAFFGADYLLLLPAFAYIQVLYLL